jgi:hypothetical protein
MIYQDKCRESVALKLFETTVDAYTGVVRLVGLKKGRRF